MPVAFDPNSGKGPNPFTGMNLGQLYAASLIPASGGGTGGSPFNSGAALQQLQQPAITQPNSTFINPTIAQQAPSAAPNGTTFPFYNAPSGQVPSPLLPNQQSGYQQQQYGYTNAPLSGDTNAYDQLLGQLAQIQQPNTADLALQAQQQAGLKYDPLIQQLQDSLTTAQGNEKAASDKIGGLYGSLGKALASYVPQITSQYNAAEDQSNANYAKLQQQIQANYQGAQDQQAAELQRLGIQAALPQSTQRLQQDQNYLGNQAATNGQSLNDALKLMGQGEADFAQRASMIAPMQGANTQSDLAQKLLQLQNQTNQQIAGYQGQKQADIAALLPQLQAAALKSYNDQQTQMIDQTSKLAQLNKLINPDVYSQPTQNYKGASGATQYLADVNAGNPSEAQNLVAILNTFLASPDNAALSGLGGVGSPNVPQEYQALAKFTKNKGGQLSDAELQQLYNALSIQAGKY